LDFRQIAHQRQIVNISTRASDAWRRCRKRNYAMSIQRLFDVVECGGDIGRRVAALVLPISNRPRMTSGCAGKIGLREPSEHTSGPNLASRDDVAHNENLYIRFWKRRHRAGTPNCQAAFLRGAIIGERGLQGRWWRDQLIPVQNPLTSRIRHRRTSVVRCSS
jgi:hypothetical protein